MAVFLVESWLVKEGREEEHEKRCIKILSYIKENRNKFKELKSARMFRVFTGRQYNMFIYIQEFESLAEMEKFDKKITRDKVYTNIIKEWQSLIEKQSVKAEIWFDKLPEKWIT